LARGNAEPRTLLALRSPEGEEGNPEPRSQKTEVSSGVRCQVSGVRSQKLDDRREKKRSLEVKKLRGWEGKNRSLEVERVRRNPAKNSLNLF